MQTELRSDLLVLDANVGYYLFASQPLDYGMKAIALKEISLLN